MHGVAPHRCGQVARPLLGGGTGGRSPGLLYSVSLTGYRGREVIGGKSAMID